MDFVWFFFFCYIFGTKIETLSKVHIVIINLPKNAI